MCTLFDLLTAELFCIIHQGWCRAAMSLIGCMVPRVWGKHERRTSTQTEDHIFPHEILSISRPIYQCLSWPLCSICPRNCCLAASQSYPHHSWDKVFLLDKCIIGRRQWLAELWESSTGGWRSAVPISAAALQPCSDAGISGTLCYKGRGSLLGKNMSFQGLFAAGELCMVHGRGVSEQLPCSHLGKQLRDAGALNSSTCTLQCLQASLSINRGGRYLLHDWTQAAALGDVCSLNVDDIF